MTPRGFRLSALDFVALSRGGGGVGAVRALVAARRSRTLLLIRHIVHRVPAAQAAFSVLVEAHRAAPDDVNRVLDHPVVGEWATRTAILLERGESGSVEFLSVVAAAAAVRAGRPAVVLPPRVGSTALPSLGIRLRVPGASFELYDWPDGPLRALRSGVDPDWAEWQDRVSGAWELLRRYGIAEEFAAAVTVLSPLRPGANGVNSATLASAFGCVFLSLADDPEIVAVTLAHELQHTKLVALMDLFSLLKPDHRETFYAPWRDDPRPLAGLLHGTYAHLGVAGFWRQSVVHRPSHRAYVEFARWRAAAREACGRMLASNRLTELGERFVSGMAEQLTTWCDEPVPADALAEAKARTERHRDRWLAVNF